MTTLVIGATGNQGGAAARALLAAGHPVRALVRDPGAPKAKELSALGAQLVTGDLADHASLLAAATGATSVFSMPPLTVESNGTTAEQENGLRLIAAAREAGVAQFIHSSVSGAGAHHRAAPGYGTGRWFDHYWDSKAAIDDAVRTAGFEHWTVLLPSTFMENLIGWSPMFGNWAESGIFITGFAADTALSWIAVDDIGTAVAAAVADPVRFHGLDLELAGNRLTMTQVAAILTEELNRPVVAPVLTVPEALERGMAPYMASTFERQNLVGQPARPEQAAAAGLRTTDFRTWAARTLAQVV